MLRWDEAAAIGSWALEEKNGYVGLFHGLRWLPVSEPGNLQITASINDDSTQMLTALTTEDSASGVAQVTVAGQ